VSAPAAAGVPGAPRRVAVLGAGAVGTLLGGLLASSGAEVVLVDPRVAPDAGDEIVIHEPDDRRVVARVGRAATPAELAAAPDLTVLAVKTFDLAAALDDLRAWPGTPVLTIQNGVGAEDLVAGARPGVGHVAGSLTAPVERPGANEVRWRGRGGIGLAPVAGPVGDLLDELVGAFSAAGLPARRIADARAMKWSKLVANLVGNAISALADRDPAEIYADPALFDLERRQMLEALAVMRAQGIGVVALPGANVPLLALGVRLPAPLSRRILARVVGGARGGKSPSLRLHLRGGAPGPSEAAWLNGAVARAGAAHGVPTPVNDALAALVDAATVDPELAASLAAEPARIVDLVARAPRRPPR
jgi:2-dehydropantoate 2-reductase